MEKEQKYTKKTIFVFKIKTYIFKDYPIGYKLTFNSLIDKLDNLLSNLCYLCNKNCSSVFSHYFVWENVKKNTIEEDILHICNNCDDSIGCSEIIRRNYDYFCKSNRTIFRGKLLSMVVKSEFFN